MSCQYIIQPAPGDKTVNAETECIKVDGDSELRRNKQVEFQLDGCETPNLFSGTEDAAENLQCM